MRHVELSVVCLITNQIGDSSVTLDRRVTCYEMCAIISTKLNE